MLKKLIIKNVALIESAEIDFEKGLNILSGETGAGKSVLLESLNFVLGAKADKTMIRRGQNEAIVKAFFDISENNPAISALEEIGVEYDDTLVLTRKLSLTESSDVRVNGEAVSLAELKKATKNLVDIHGQSEHFYLLKETNQLELLDKFGEAAILDVKTKLSEKVKEERTILKELENLGGDDQKRAVRLDILNFQINEIERANLKEGEEESLTKIKKRLQNLEKISSSLGGAKEALSSEVGALESLSAAVSALKPVENLSEKYAEYAERLRNAYTELSDVSDALFNELDGFDEADYDLNTVENRLYEISSIKKKYGEDFTKIQKFYEDAVSERDKLCNYDELAAKYLLAKEKTEKEIYALYSVLRSEREKAAKTFSERVVTEIRELNMKNAVLDVAFSDFPSMDTANFLQQNGVDNVSILFSANKGEPPLPLSKIISGGEISRLMLALKAQTAKFNDISTFIFDEIDAGISGETAFVVGKKFIGLSKDVQIIAISHLPQIVAAGETNFLIYKTEESDKTVTNVKKLTKEELTQEIVRLSGGKQGNTESVRHAEALIKDVASLK